MRKAMLFVSLIVLLFAGTPSGGQNCTVCEPEEPDPGTGCVECYRGDYDEAVCGSTAAWGDPSNWACVGGYRCYPTANGTYCEPNCGTRCYSV